jgi:hydroxypyruvate isomerase
VCRRGTGSAELRPVSARYGPKNVPALNGMPDPGSAHALNQEKHHEEILDRTRRMIEQCAHAGVPNMIAFTGYK